MKHINEIWKSVVGYEGLYEVNENCEVRSLHERSGGTFLKCRIDRAGYYTVRLSKSGVTRTHFVHRIGATAFIPNPENKRFVNHLNGNKHDNRIINFEWSTHSENIQHAYSSHLIKSKSNLVYDLVTGMVFLSSKQAASYYDLNPNTVRNYLNGGSRNPTGLIYLT